MVRRRIAVRRQRQSFCSSRWRMSVFWEIMKEHVFQFLEPCCGLLWVDALSRVWKIATVGSFWRKYSSIEAVLFARSLRWLLTVATAERNACCFLDSVVQNGLQKKNLKFRTELFGFFFFSIFLFLHFNVRRNSMSLPHPPRRFFFFPNKLRPSTHLLDWLHKSTRFPPK